MIMVQLGSLDLNLLCRVSRYTPVTFIPGKPLGHEVPWEWNWDNTRAKNSHSRIQPLALASGQQPRPLHNRFTRTGNFVCWGMTVTYNRYKFVAVSLPKRLRAGDGRFASETAVRRSTWTQKWFKISVGTSRGL